MQERAEGAVTEYPRVAEVAEVWTRTKIVSPNIRYLVAILRFVAIYTLFGRLGAKKCFFGITTVFLGKEVHYHMVYITYTE